MTKLTHLPLRVYPKTKEMLSEMADTEGMNKSEYTRYILRVGLTARQAAIRKTKRQSENFDG